MIFTLALFLVIHSISLFFPLPNPWVIIYHYSSLSKKQECASLQMQPQKGRMMKKQQSLISHWGHGKLFACCLSSKGKENDGKLLSLIIVSTKMDSAVSEGGARSIFSLVSMHGKKHLWNYSILYYYYKLFINNVSYHSGRLAVKKVDWLFYMN